MKLLALATAALVVFSAGSTVTFAASHGQTAGNQSGPDAAITVTAGNVGAEEVQIEDVELTNQTIGLDELDLSGSGLENAIRAAIGSNAEGFEVESVETGTLRTASIDVENNTATVNAEFESITFESVSADRVVLDGTMMYSDMIRPVFEGGALSFDTMTVQELSVGTLTSEPVEEETPTEPGPPIEPGPPAEPGPPTEPIAENASVTLENQTSGGMVVNVTSFTLPDGGYVAIHDNSLLEGDAVGSVIGVSEYFEPGTYENESISLFDVSGANFTEAQLTGSQTLIAMPHEETNDNTTYDFVATDGTADGPSTINGTAVTDDATVTVEES